MFPAGGMLTAGLEVWTCRPASECALAARTAQHCYLTAGCGVLSSLQDRGGERKESSEWNSAPPGAGRTLPKSPEYIKL